MSSISLTREMNSCARAVYSVPAIGSATACVALSGNQRCEPCFRFGHLGAQVCAFFRGRRACCERLLLADENTTKLATRGSRRRNCRGSYMGLACTVTRFFTIHQSSLDVPFSGPESCQLFLIELCGLSVSREDRLDLFAGRDIVDVSETPRCAGLD